MSLKNRNRIQAVLDLATAADFAEGKAWYSRALIAAQRLAGDYDITVKTAAGVITALSPRNKWDRNLLDAEKIISVYVSAGADEALNVKVCTFTANKKKAIAILKSEGVHTEDILYILKGPKMIEFYSCIIGLNDVCIDGHAYSIWLGERVALKDTPAIGVKLRREIKEDYIKVAAKNNLASYELQAITWVCWRRLHGVA